MDRLPTDEIVAATALSMALANHPDYEIVRKLGGGTGVVFLARNRHMGRHEVLRIIGPDIIARPGVRDHFLREIRSVARLRHPNIVTAYSGFRWEESLVFAMEYAEGLDLARLVKASGPLPIAHACSFVYQAALGLQHAHRAGLVHRDIKPGNLMLTRKGSRAIVKVLDFGVAKAGREQRALSVFGLEVLGRESATTDDPIAASQILSTPDYIAPEQIADAHAVDIRADIRADIYSLGCTLYFLLSGRPPFQGATVHDVLQAQHSMNALPLNKARPDVPAELAALVAKAMAKDPDERFQTPEELANALAPFFKNRRMAGDTPNFGGSSPAAHRQPLGQSSPARGTDTESAFPGSAAGNVNAIWSNLIDLSELPDDSDDGPADDRPQWPRSVVAGVVVGLTTAILLVGLIIGFKALRSSSATILSTKADMPPIAVAQTERPPPPVQVPTPSPAFEPSPGTEAPKPTSATGPVQIFRETASTKTPDPVIQARLLPDARQFLSETGGTNRALSAKRAASGKTGQRPKPSARYVFGDITPAHIKESFEKNAKKQDARINGSDNESNQIPRGTILLYVTDEGRYGKLQVLEYDYNLTIRWVTYDRDGNVFSRGDRLVVRGTFRYDLDYGVEEDEGKSKRDFWWEQQTQTIRYLASQNGATFILFDLNE